MISVDFDLAQVRAFVAVTDDEHFGRAAARLHLSQQAVSRRIQRLEQLLGTPLFVRGINGAELTPDGARFLPFARQLLAQADAAYAAVTGVSRPLRIDVWGYLPLGPLRFVDNLAEPRSGFRIEISMRRNLWSAMEGLRRGELDVAFGRVHDLAQPWPGELRKRLVQLEPFAAIVGRDHRLAGRSAICPRDLTTSTLWAPPITTAPEMLTWFEHFARDFHIPIRYREPSWIPNIDEQARFVSQHPDSVGIIPARTTPADPSARVIAFTAPVPRMPWSMVWRRDDRNPELAKFLHVVTESLIAQRWTACDLGSDWIPAPDRADFSAGAHFGR